MLTWSASFDRIAACVGKQQSPRPQVLSFPAIALPSDEQMHAPLGKDEQRRAPSPG